MKKHWIENRDFSEWNKTRLMSVLDRIQKKRILVIGDVGVDRYTIGEVDRISPEAPVPVLWVQQEKHKLGLAANVADNIKALGAEPFLFGVIGKDAGASIFKMLLAEISVTDRYLVTDLKRRTIIKERVMSGQHQIVRIDYESEGLVDSKLREKVFNKVKALLPKVDAVILQDYAKGLIDSDFSQKLISECRRRKIILAADPNMKTATEVYAGATILCPNKKEAEALSGVSIHDDASLVQAGRRILSKTKSDSLIIKMSREGMAVFKKGGGAVVRVPTFAREVYDVSGAGDTVVAMVTLALSAGASLEDAAILGNVAAGIEVGKLGTATVTCEEIRNELMR
jgi:rfaE bifunctional protein kinase chain/domain